MTIDRSKKQIEADISGLLARTGAEPYWPGGSGGGGSRRAKIGQAVVVKPHARTSTTCTRCAQYHSTAEHDRHARGAKAKAKSKSRPKAKAKAKAKAKVKSKVKAKSKRKAKAKSRPKAKTKAPGWARS